MLGEAGTKSEALSGFVFTLLLAGLISLGLLLCYLGWFNHKKWRERGHDFLDRDEIDPIEESIELSGRSIFRMPDDHDLDVI